MLSVSVCLFPSYTLTDWLTTTWTYIHHNYVYAQCNAHVIIYEYATGEREGPAERDARGGSELVSPSGRNCRDARGTRRTATIINVCSNVFGTSRHVSTRFRQLRKRAQGTCFVDLQHSSTLCVSCPPAELVCLWWLWSSNGIVAGSLYCIFVYMYWLTYFSVLYVHVCLLKIILNSRTRTL